MNLLGYYLLCTLQNTTTTWNFFWCKRFKTNNSDWKLKTPITRLVWFFCIPKEPKALQHQKLLLIRRKTLHGKKDVRRRQAFLHMELTSSSYSFVREGLNSLSSSSYPAFLSNTLMIYLWVCNTTHTYPTRLVNFLSLFGLVKYFRLIQFSFLTRLWLVCKLKFTLTWRTVTISM